MSDVSVLLAKTLKNNGYSVTKARSLVFAALDQEEPIAMHKLVASLAESIDRASVYRTIALYEKLGIARRIQMGWKYRLELSEQFNYHHHHISCMICGTIVPLRNDQTLEAIIQSMATEYGFALSDHQLEIQGLCNRCSVQNMDPSGDARV